jgi:hypothetical protein
VDIVKYIIELTVWLASAVGRGVTVCTDLGRRDQFDLAVKSAVEPYLPVLVSKRQKLLRADEYGLVNQIPWANELNYFLTKVLLPNLSGYERYARRNLRYTANLVDAIVSEHQPLPPL